ncbi:hypothetical protein F2Q68_00041484 [Brassica cretica]|uniref:Uncharacterized protein n=1 Tax=Brassica cretica TaxID=69181 RepID=A0A8S9MD27_BRACR|nr:hypothetical protein F2Q68_00041484 [Brassica cretica]
MFSSQIKEKPPDGFSLHQSPNKSTRVLSDILFERRGYSNAQSNKNGSLAKLEMQQSNLGSCLAASFDIGAVRGSYLSNQKELSNKLNCHGNLTHHGLTSNWNHVQIFSYDRVINFTSRVILCLLCLKFSEFRTSQTYLWRPDYMEALKHTKGKNKREEDKRFKPPDLNQERHQDFTCFILIKEAPPDAAYKPKPIKYNFGIRLLLYDEDIKKLSQVIMDVEKQFRETHTTRPSLEEQNQELITSVSELNSAEPVSTTSIQGDQAKESSVAIQKDEQPVQNVMVPFKQAIVPEETPREPQTACKKGQLIVFDPCDLQKTFLDTFLIHLFVWNKTRAVELSRHELGMEHVVFERGGDLWDHRNNPIVIEKKSAATTIVFGDLLPSEVKGMHVSAQQELQIYLWKPGAYDSILIIPGECSARARTSLGNKELEADQNVLLLDHVKMQQSNLGSCLAAIFDIGAVRGSYLSNQKEKQQTQLPWKLNSSWSHVELESCPKVLK